MVDGGLILILGMLFGFYGTLAVLAVLVLREFGRVVNEQFVARRGRFRLRTLLIVATVAQGAIGFAAWQLHGRPFSLVTLLVHSAFSFVVLGLAVWILWYIADDFLAHSTWGWSVRDRYGIDAEPGAPRAPPAGGAKRRKKWWLGKWPNRTRPYAPGQDYRIPTHYDES